MTKREEMVERLKTETSFLKDQQKDKEREVSQEPSLRTFRARLGIVLLTHVSVHPRLIVVHPRLIVVHPRLIVVHPRLIVVHPRLTLVRPTSRDSSPVDLTGAL